MLNINHRTDTANYRELFLSQTPLIDLRAPCEYNKGSFPGAVSLPLMTDIERQKVGTCYKRDGQQAAIKLGHQLVKGEIREERLAGWVEFAKQNLENGYLFCFRGGLRSRTVQSWLADSGIYYPMVSGGYKALRRFLIDTTERLTVELPFYIIAGLTGSAKTILLKKLTNNIDLEALANHRGSSFGRQLIPQPSQIDFENLLAIELLKLEEQSASYITLEDEGRLIGARSTPPIFFNKMKEAPLIFLEADFNSRVEHIHQEYVIDMYGDYCHSGHKEPIALFTEYLLTSIDKIRKRLGNEVHLSLRNKILAAVEFQAKQGSFDYHRAWIEQLLTDYYDPMYHFQLKKKQPRLIFRGNSGEVEGFIEQLTAKH